MKQFLLSVILTLMAAFGAAAAGKAGHKVGVEFAQTSYEFGNVSENAKPVTHVFTYTNTGTTPVAVIWVKSSCGCTVPEYDRKPLMPGQEAKLKVTFNPKGQRGEVKKDIRVRMRNGEKKSEEITLRLTGAVIPSKE